MDFRCLILSRYINVPKELWLLISYFIRETFSRSLHHFRIYTRIDEILLYHSKSRFNRGKIITDGKSLLCLKSSLFYDRVNYYRLKNKNITLSGRN